MKRPQRTIRRVSALLYRGRRLVLIVPPVPDVLMIREQGRRTCYEVSILDVFRQGAINAANARMAERKAKRQRVKRWWETPEKGFR
jgi:hypothetical protein